MTAWHGKIFIEPSISMDEWKEFRMHKKAGIKNNWETVQITTFEVNSCIRPQKRCIMTCAPQQFASNKNAMQFTHLFNDWPNISMENVSEKDSWNITRLIVCNDWYRRIYLQKTHFYFYRLNLWNNLKWIVPQLKRTIDSFLQNERKIKQIRKS